MSDKQLSQTETIREVIRDTVIKFKADESMLQALLECDSSGQVIMKELLNYQAGDRLKPPEAIVKDNVLTVTAKVDSLSVYLSLKDRYTEIKQAEVLKETVTVEVNRLTGWQKFRIWTGSIVLILVPVGLYLKFKKTI